MADKHASEDLPDVNWFLRIGNPPSTQAATASSIPTKNASTPSASPPRTYPVRVVHVVHKRDPVASKKVAVPAALPPPPRTLSPRDVFDFRNENVKPPTTYMQMIVRYVKQKPDGCIVLAELYDYIQNEYCYYRSCRPGWKSSVRHNLAQAKLFKKTLKGGNYCWTMTEIARRVVRDKTNIRGPSSVNAAVMKYIKRMKDQDKRLSDFVPTDEIGLYEDDDTPLDLDLSLPSPNSVGSLSDYEALSPPIYDEFNQQDDMLFPMDDFYSPLGSETTSPMTLHPNGDDWANDFAPNFLSLESF